MKKLITLILIIWSIGVQSQEYNFMFPDSTVEFSGVLNQYTLFNSHGKKKDKYKAVNTKDFKASKSAQDTIFITGKIWYMPSVYSIGVALQSTTGTGFRINKTNEIIINGIYGVVLTDENGDILTAQNFTILFNSYLSECSNNGREPKMQDFTNSFWVKERKNNKEDK